MDRESAAKFQAMQERLEALQQQLDDLRAPRSSGETVCLKQAAHLAGCSSETLRRKILRDPAWQKQGNRWVKRM
jgi:hypothetical protein